MFLLTQSKSGLSAMKLKRQVSVNYDIAWKMKHKLLLCNLGKPLMLVNKPLTKGAWVCLRLLTGGGIEHFLEPLQADLKRLS